MANELGFGGPAASDLPEDVAGLAKTIATALSAAERPLVVTGTSYGSNELAQIAASIAWSLIAQGRQARLAFMAPECNSLGLAMMQAGNVQDAFQAVADGQAGTVIVLENDLYRRADATDVDAFFARAGNVVVLDHITTRTTDKASVVLPAATFAESVGTLVNNEGRAQRFFEVLAPNESIQASWRWLSDIMAASGKPALAWQTVDDLITALATELPRFSAIVSSAPSADFRIVGQKIARQHAASPAAQPFRLTSA